LLVLTRNLILQVITSLLKMEKTCKDSIPPYKKRKAKAKILYKEIVLPASGWDSAPAWLPLPARLPLDHG
jgi:hypothetical protein